MEKYIESVTWLLQENTAMHRLSSSNGHHKAILALQRLGTTSTATNAQGKTPSDCFADPRARQFYEKLKPNLWEAIESGDAAAVENRLEKWCFPVSGVNSEGETVSMMDLAKDMGKEDIVGILETYSETLDFIRRILAADLEEAQEYLEKGGLDDINVNMVETEHYEDLDAKPLSRPLIIVTIEDVRIPEVAQYVVKKGGDLRSVYTQSAHFTPA